MIKDACKAAIAAVLGFWLSFHPLTQALIVLILADIVTGLLAGFVCRNLNSKITYRGMAKKSLMLILASVGHYVDAVWKVGFDVGAIVSGFYCINELLSILENCAAAGLPIPVQLIQAIAKIKEIEGVESCDVAVKQSVGRRCRKQTDKNAGLLT